jgi:hypothetical protein
MTVQIKCAYRQQRRREEEKKRGWWYAKEVPPGCSADLKEFAAPLSYVVTQGATVLVAPECTLRTEGKVPKGVPVIPSAYSPCIGFSGREGCAIT